MKNFRHFPDFELNFSNATNFETKFSHCVRFWFKSFTTPHFLDWKKLQRVRFWNKTFLTCHIFEKMFASKKSPFGSFYSMKRHILQVLHFRAFQKSMVFNWRTHYLSDFELKKHFASDFEFEKNTKRHSLNWKKNNARQVFR